MLCSTAEIDVWTFIFMMKTQIFTVQLLKTKNQNYITSVGLDVDISILWLIGYQINPIIVNVPAFCTKAMKLLNKTGKTWWLF